MSTGASRGPGISGAGRRSLWLPLLGLTATRGLLRLRLVRAPRLRAWHDRLQLRLRGICVRIVVLDVESETLGRCMTSRRNVIRACSG